MLSRCIGPGNAPVFGLGCFSAAQPVSPFLRDQGWQHISVPNARLTLTDLKKPLSDHRVLIAEVESSEHA
jgi:hypothetical protein